MKILKVCVKLRRKEKNEKKGCRKEKEGNEIVWRGKQQWGMRREQIKKKEKGWRSERGGGREHWGKKCKNKNEGKEGQLSRENNKMRVCYGKKKLNGETFVHIIRSKRRKQSKKYMIKMGKIVHII